MEELSLRKILLSELKNANTILAKYENGLMERDASDPANAVGSAGVEFYKERINYWSEAASELRKQIFNTKTD